MSLIIDREYTKVHDRQASECELHKFTLWLGMLSGGKRVKKDAHNISRQVGDMAEIHLKYLVNI